MKCLWTAWSCVLGALDGLYCLVTSVSSERARYFSAGYGDADESHKFRCYLRGA